MAATVTSAWAKPGAWALEAEESEAVAAGDTAQLETSDFPSLAAAVSTKGSKKKKPAKVSLAEFTTGHSVAPGAGKARPESTRLTTDELLSLPTGPRERTAEELERRGGFGYSSYGSREPRGAEERSGRGERGAPAGGFREPIPPSRADESDDWGAVKKTSAGPPPPRERSGGFFDSQSRADGTDSWVSNKSSMAAPPANGRRSEGLRERRGGFEFHKDGSGADADSWGRRREEPLAGPGAGSGAGLSSSRPKLMLQPRTLPLENTNGDQQPKAKGANPFGAARPREEVLAEKGQDWKKLDEKLDSMKIREVRPISREGSGFGRRGSGVEDRMEGKWRRDDSSASPPPPAERPDSAGHGVPDN